MTSWKNPCAIFLLGVAAALLISPTTANANDCPQCDVYQTWLSENSRVCGYHGARLHSICEGDPECVKWNKACREKRDQLHQCLERCRQTPPASEIDDFDRDVQAMENEEDVAFPAGSREAQIAACQRGREHLNRTHPVQLPGGAIGTVIGVTGPVDAIRCQGAEGYPVLRKGDPIYLGDIVRTGLRGRIRIRMNDYDPDSRGKGPSFINIGENSEMSFERFEMDFSPNQYKTGNVVLDLLKGTLRTFLTGWSRGSSFSARAGVSVCGIRGSDVFMAYAPDAGRVEVGVIEGHARLYNAKTGVGHELPGGTRSTASNGEVGSPQQFSRADWNHLMVRHGLNLGEGLDPGVGLPRVLPLVCRGLIGSWRWFTGYRVDFTEDGRWQTGDGVHPGSWQCLSNESGGTSFIVIPDAGGWQDTVVIGPDGSSLSGKNQAGAPVTATRIPPGK